MSWRGVGGGGYPAKKSNNSSNNSGQKGFSMNAVPPPSSLMGRSNPFQKSGGFSSSSTSSSSGNNNSSGSGSVKLTPGLSKHGYSTMDAISQFANSSQYAVGKRKAKTEDEYFEDDEDNAPAASASDLAYIPAPGSPSNKKSDNSGGDTSDEEDPLDAFMQGLEQHLEKEKKKVPTADAKPQYKGVRGDIDDEDDEESYYRYMEENPNAGVIDEGSDNEIEYDEDGNPIAPPRRRDIDPLPPIDHSEFEYKSFEKNFYTPHEDIANLSRSQVEELRNKLGVRVTGPSPPKPVTSFGHFGFDDQLIKSIRKSEYTQPTAIQSQAIPAALSGRDLIGIAKTGSGKTAAFLWPMLVHIMDQPELRQNDGPLALILAPTRELSLQIYNEAKKFGKVYNINVVCCYGGGSKWEQSKALEQGAEIVVATPGRMIDMVKIKATNLQRVTYLVLDEADKMFNMGFEPQVRSICNHVRPDRQTLLFSATFKKRIEKLARDVLTDPVKIVQGDLGEANQDITQHMLVFTNPMHKQNWLFCKLVEFLSEGSILVFVTKKADAEGVANQLQLKEYECVLLHGDMDQADRNKVITQFKRKEVDIMVATDVAARGLDIPHIRTVINYDIARDIDTHTHRIGRTGRAGEKGSAYTLVLEKDKEFAGHLVRNLEGANQEVPEALLELAMQSSWFKKSRFKGGKGKAVGGAGLGYKERPGLGSSESSGGGGGGSGGGGGGGGSGSNSGTGGGGSFKTNYVNHDESSSSSNRSGGSGPATNRFTALRETFKNQYTSQFRASTDRTWEENIPAQTAQFARPASMPQQQHHQQQKQQHNMNTEEDDSKKSKRSRWN